MRNLWYVAILALLGLWSCDNRHAGGVTDIGNSVAGTIVNAQGKPQVGARVTLVRVNASISGVEILDSLSTITDDQGAFLVTKVSAGSWIVKGSVGSLAALDHVNKIKDEGVDSLHMVLGAPRTLQGHIVFSSYGGRAFVLGVTNVLQSLDSMGEFAIQSLPPGHFELCFSDSIQVYCRDFVSAANVDTLNLLDLRPATSGLEWVDYAVDSLPSYYLGKDFATVQSVDTTTTPAWLWSHEITIDFAVAAPTQTLSAFPLAVKLDSSNIEFARMHMGGRDLRILDSLGKRLDFEIESWDSTNSSALVWVRIPSIVAGQTRVRLWILGDNAQAVTASSPKNVFAAGDGFLGVYHFAESSLDSLSKVHDASSFGHHGVMPQPAYARSGHLGGGLSFDGIDDYVDLGTWDPCGGDFTASLWVNWKGFNGRHQVLFAKRNAWMPDSTRWQWHYDLFRGGFGVYQIAIDTTKLPLFSASSVTLNDWSYLTMVYHADSVRMWVNGVQIDSAQAFTPGTFVGATLRLGGSDAGESWNGSFDEVRLESGARNEDWIRLAMQTQKQAANP